MNYAKAALFSKVLLIVALSTAYAISAAQPLSFTYEEDQATAEGTCLHTANVEPIAGRAYVYCTFEMGTQNPVPHVDGKPQALQKVTLGQRTEAGFVPAVRFGLDDNRRCKDDEVRMTTWVSDGRIDRYGPVARPGTECDFKLKLDLTGQRLWLWTSRPGDDDWFLLGDSLRLIDPTVTAINEVQVEQFPGAAGISALTIQAEPWSAAQPVRPHPLAKPDRLVGPGRGFTFQQMRSVWRKAGRHVTIMRDPDRWFGFPDVCQVDENTLACAYVDGPGHGGGWDLFVQLSNDLGQTWGEPIHVDGKGCKCPRIQRLQDGTLLISDDHTHTSVAFYASTDGGKTWIKRPSIDPKTTTGKDRIWIPGRVLEMPDGSWLVPCSWFGGFEGLENTERLQIFRSTDRGESWEFISDLHQYPPHNLSEPSMVRLADGGLVVYTREWREDGIPSIRGYSSDGGETWEAHEVPFPVSGRTAAGLLSDGRVMITFRSGVGTSALWAWIGDPLDPTGFQPLGIHHNDRYSVGLKDGGLHIDTDGARDQQTTYILRAPDSRQTTIDLTVEVKVVENKGWGPSVSVPWVGTFCLFPDRVELAHDPSVKIDVTPGEFHTYRIVRKPGNIRLYVDGELALDTDQVDESTILRAPSQICSTYQLTFGDRARSSDGTGYSIWRRVEEILDDPVTGRKVLSWSAESGRFPDQNQLDHIVEVDATISLWDQGYSGWTELSDGRIFVVNYTDDTTPGVRSDRSSNSWIRGTYLLPEDLPPRSK